MLCKCDDCKYNNKRGACSKTNGIMIDNNGVCNWHTVESNNAKPHYNYNPCDGCLVRMYYGDENCGNCVEYSEYLNSEVENNDTE